MDEIETLFVGIDIAKDELVVYVLNSNSRSLNPRALIPFIESATIRAQLWGIELLIESGQKEFEGRRRIGLGFEGP